MPRFVRTYNAIQWDGSNLDDVVAVLEQRGSGLGFGPVNEDNQTLSVPSGSRGDMPLHVGDWFVANDAVGEFLSDEDFRARYSELK